MRRLWKMDEGVLCEHAALGFADECYFLLEYLPGQRYGANDDNNLIKNFKRRIDRSDGIALKRKEWAIRDLAILLRPALAEVVDFASTTIVPVPPSKTISHLFYDDRVARLLGQACPAGADIRELIAVREDREAAHEREHRPGVEELLGNYVLADGGAVRETIVLFDDVITSGNHFVACKRFLLRHFPGREVVGMFLARRAL